MSSATSKADPVKMGRLHPIIHDIEPLLDFETFTLAETPIGGSSGDIHQTKGVLKKLTSAGAIHRNGRVQVTRHAPDLADDEVRVDPLPDATTTVNSCWQYAWADGARENLQAYLDQLETLPCGHRVHFPDSRDDPEGRVSCKFCGEDYDKDWFGEFVAGKL